MFALLPLAVTKGGTFLTSWALTGMSTPIALTFFLSVGFVVALLLTAGIVLAQAVPIPRDGSKPCPFGYTAAGSYCAPVSANSRQAMDRPTGGTCPHGWSPSGSGCLKNR